MITKNNYKIRYSVLGYLVVLHAGAIYALFNWSLLGFVLAVGLWVFTGMVGISVGYHRLLAHKSFSTSKYVKYIHILAGIISFQQGPISWVRLHRSHHSFSDKVGDPHSQLNGFFWGHMGWSFLKHSQHGRNKMLKIQPKDLASDPVICFLERNFLRINLIFMCLVFLIGGMNILCWAVCLRAVAVLHFTWTVNSLAHRFGYRTFDTQDSSKNNLLVAALTFGEGWHNNHHRYPSSAQLGYKKWEIDMGWYWIKLLESCGLVWNVKNIKKLSRNNEHKENAA